MRHNNNCDMFNMAVDVFIMARPAQFLTVQELKILALAFPPCTCCSIPENRLSPMTGRLYHVMWQLHRKEQQETSGEVIDMFPAPEFRTISITEPCND